VVADRSAASAAMRAVSLRAALANAPRTSSQREHDRPRSHLRTNKAALAQ
jgi:hypothetical protein